MKSTTLVQKIPLLKSGLRVGVDSCVLIHLNRIQLLEMYSTLHDVMVTRAVYNEITTETSHKQIYDDKSIYKKLFAHTVLDKKHSMRRPQQHSAALSEADMSLVYAWNAGSIAGIVTDDKSLCRYCRAHGIEHLNAPMVLFALLVNRRLTAERYRLHRDEVYAMGRYGHFVHTFMEKIYAEYCTEYE